MADRKRKMTTGAKYVAVGALTEAIQDLPELEHLTPEGIAAGIVADAWDVEFFPNAGRVAITLDVNQLVNGDPEA